MKNSRPSRGAAIVVAVIVTAMVVILWDFIVAEWNARDAQREIASFANSIQIGATRQTVTETFNHGNFQHLTRRPYANDEWLFQTPHRIGATDWILIIGFERERVVSVRVATSDDLRRRPAGAPADRVEQITR